MNKHKTAHTVEIDAIRLDKWLWAARFYKTRKLAAEAIAGGKIHLNEQRSKPGKEVKIGAQLLITKDLYQWDITITSLAKHRRPAKEALLLYQESQDSLAKRQKQILLNRENKTQSDNYKDHRPNKKERRQIHRFVRQ
ncbi:MAG: S4 domain-containing protein [Methylococcales bacterium]